MKGPIPVTKFDYYFIPIVFLLIIGGACCPKKPSHPDQPPALKSDIPKKVSTVISGNCYRYPNKNEQDVHMKVIKTYDKGGFLAEFIVEKTLWTDVHEFKDEVRHLKEIDCYMFDDLKGLSKPAKNG